MTPASVHVPPELWVEIFRFAMDDQDLYDTGYHPFHGTFGDMGRAALSTKYAIIRVCRHWYALGVQLLYADVHIRHGTAALADVLSAPDTARWVRRASLPYTETATPTAAPHPALALLPRLPRLATLVRPPPTSLFAAPRFEFPAPDLALPGLRRLEWWHSDDAARSGGANALPDVLAHAPGLALLALAGDMTLPLLRARRLALPALRVLALCTGSAVLVRQVCCWALPALSAVRIAAPPRADALDALWETFGRTLARVEFGAHLRFMLADYVGAVPPACAGLREVNYYVFFTTRPLFGSGAHEGLRRVGMHGLENGLFGRWDDAEAWRHLQGHVEAYPRVLFPALEEFVLYGREWARIQGDVRFEAVREAVESAGRRLVVEDLVCVLST